MHSFDAPFWGAPPNYHTDAGVSQVNVRGVYMDDSRFGSYARGGFTPVPLSGQIMTGPACLSRPLIVRQPHPFIRRQLSHTWQTFYCQYSDWLFAWLGGHLDCRCSPPCTWKPEANRFGFASASSALG
ncbi:hypothetical protein O181_099440 [Austropuccinia psidii MF-1]|uniref:Uncharacterized protein n=1 Tax=Austropuccinia psidii MF-1 TaxID=1389203 RepID=A0A9Q3JB03_9BASI|nr:hypothetical protein [Austropuccinia psidii MF-1]